MGMDPLTMGAIGMGVGSLVGGATDVYNSGQANKRFGELQRLLMPHLTNGPSGYEGMLQELLGRMPSDPVSDWQVPSAEGLLSGQAWNTGQDSLMQLLRADPRTQVDSSLENMLTGGGFDTSALFDAYRAQDTRRRGEALAELRSGAGSLGQRFGSALQQDSADMLTQLLENSGARDAQIAISSYENNENRKLAAAEQLSGRENANRTFQSGIAQLLSNMGLSEANLGLQASDQRLRQDQLNRGGEENAMQMMMGVLSQLLGAEQGRRGNNAQLLSLLFGMQMPGMANLGGSIGDMSQMLMFLPMMRQMGSGGGS